MCLYAVSLPAIALRRLSTLSAIILGSLACAAAASAAEPVGRVDKLERQAVAVLGGQSRDMGLNGPVYFKDMIRTGAASRLESKLADGTVLTLGEHARITVDEFVYRPDRPGGRLGLTVARGAFLFVGGKIEGPTGGNVAIRTAVGTLGVRGTTVWGGAIDGGFGVLVLDGLVTLRTGRGSVTLRKGQGTMVYPGRAPPAAAPGPEDRTKRAVATISFTPQR
ncbi:MAG TPA: FecR family protein [Geminicoccaceae bacterium]